MSDQLTAIIYGRSIQLEVVIPGNRHLAFVEAFMGHFKQADFDGGLQPREIDRLFYHPNGYHVVVTVGEGAEEQKFLDFMRDFCISHRLRYRVPTRQDGRPKLSLKETTDVLKVITRNIKEFNSGFDLSVVDVIGLLDSLWRGHEYAFTFSTQVGAHYMVKVRYPRSDSEELVTVSDMNGDGQVKGINQAATKLFNEEIAVALCAEEVLASY